jgi:hypothetical protein
MVFDKVHLQKKRCPTDVCPPTLSVTFRWLNLLNNPLLHALIVCMFQFDTKLFTLQLLPLKTDVYFLTIQQKDILYAKRLLGCKELNFMRVISYFCDALGPIVENKNEFGGKWRPFYFILFRK